MTEHPLPGEAIETSRLDALYRVHATKAKRTAFLLTGDAEAARDLVQDAFVRLAGRFSDLRSPDAFGAYLRRTIVRLVRSKHRKASREAKHMERHGLPPVAAQVDMESVVAVRAALMKLNLRQRTAVVLRYYEDLSEADIADALRCRPGTVKSLLSRGLDILREDLSR